MVTLPYGLTRRRRWVRSASIDRQGSVMVSNPPKGSRPLPVPPGYREMREEVLLKLYALGTVMTWQALADAIGVDFVTVWRYRGGRAKKEPLSTPDNRAQRAILEIYEHSVLAGRDPRRVLADAGVPLPPWIAPAPSETP